MPNRIIKESICSSDSLSGLSDFEENFFYKIMVNCDDYGRFDARPAILKSRCYPLRERLTLKNIEDALSSLARVGCVELYKVDGKPFLCLPTWEVHQQVRAKKPKFPAPDNIGYQMIADDCICPRNPIQSESLSLSESNIEPNGSLSSKPTCQEIVDAFNSICISYPKVKTMSKDREKAIKARLNQYSLDDFKRMFETAETSSFLKGKNDRNWTANFDWLITDRNMAKVIEGNYDNQQSNKSKPPAKKSASYDIELAAKKALEEFS